MEKLDGQSFYIQSVSSNKVFDISGGDQSNGAKLILYTLNGTDNQKFTLEKHGNFYAIKAVHSGLVLDVPAGSLENGEQIIQYEGHGGNNQLFSFIVASVSTYLGRWKTKEKWKVTKIIIDSINSIFSSRSSHSLAQVTQATVVDHQRDQIWRNHTTLEKS